ARSRSAPAGPAPPGARRGSSVARSPTRAGAARRPEARRRRAGAPERAPRDRDQRCRALAVLGRERLSGGADPRRELGHVAEPLPFRAQRFLVLGLHPECVLDERPQLGEPSLGRVSAAAKLVVAPARGLQSLPRLACPRPPPEL